MANTLNLGTNGNWATKKDSLLGYNSENGNFKPLPFDFTRASSATVVNKDGLIETVGSGQPRIDFLGNTQGALKLEPQRTNLFTYSEDISNSFWIKDNISITNNSIVSPDGLQTADKLVENTSNSKHRFFNNNFGLTSGSVSLSCFAKAGERDELEFSEGVGGNGIKVNLTDGTFTLLQSATGGVHFIGNGWYHIYFSYTVSSFVQTRVAILKDDVDIYQGDGSSGLYVWGLQQEVGSYATSYIPTQGGVVTRLADSCDNGGNEQVINSTEGVLYAEMSALANDLTQRFISLSDGTTTNRLILGFDNSSNRIISFARVGGALSFDIKETVSNIQSYNKIAIKWKENDFALWSNGVELGIDTSGASFSSNVLNTLKFSDADGTTEIFNGNTKDVRVYNTALTDSELQALTTI